MVVMLESKTMFPGELARLIWHNRFRRKNLWYMRKFCVLNWPIGPRIILVLIVMAATSHNATIAIAYKLLSWNVRGLNKV